MHSLATVHKKHYSTFVSIHIAIHARPNVTTQSKQRVTAALNATPTFSATSVLTLSSTAALSEITVQNATSTLSTTSVPNATAAQSRAAPKKRKWTVLLIMKDKTLAQKRAKIRRWSVFRYKTMNTPKIAGSAKSSKSV